MNLLSDKNLLFVLKFIIIPIMIVKVLYSFSLFYLDKELAVRGDNKGISFLAKTNLAYKILEKQKKQTTQKVVKAEKKITDFKLKGTYVDGDNSFVIIDDKGNTEFVYLNETYQGYKLIQVYDNKAIFEKDGSNYELNLYSNSSQDFTTSPDVENTAQREVYSSQNAVPIDINKEDVLYYATNPNKIWNNIRIRDYRTDDGIEFKIGYIRKGTIFDKIGLKKGDIITAIEGQKPQSMADVMKYYSQIDNLDSLTLTIRRGSQEMDVEFNVKE